MITRTFTKEFMQDTVYGDNDVEVVYDKIIDQTRWSVVHEAVFKSEGSFYLTNYNVGATESQDESAYEYDDDGVKCTLVEPIEVKIIEYKPVEEGK